MNRRDSLKALGLGTLSAGLLLEACKTDTKKGAEESTTAAAGDEVGRQPFEVERDKKLHADKFFTTAEMATITVLADIIIPKDDKSGSASDAKVPDFIEFIVKDMPDHQTPMRGGLRWLDLQCLNRFGKPFTDCTKDQQIQLIDMIAYPAKAKPEMAQGVAFFNRMRDLTASGFFTSEIGVKDIGYAGNQPGKWTGVPDDILKHYGMENVKASASM
ncbi:gluconate 2-dehydrogenase subunit 3 family protein [Mucilaginibacter sp. P25]|uniref:Gluconate 2-dehydrogenase subunit 3 n=1 Tax=Mucilaginibacter gossypii TaxID=551996 RepID=A0A1G8AXN8_9SPHI|nr:MULTISPECIES: gluconate 2-dehydrogenase subunit 3 family protein [Mucilaginibacter]QTE35561.1 gluconate 2-dehydrogenase subunit 3 family protein [Mucilaginibacter gossypii]RAV46520.1 gluconate 2-dehydrogenase subunit 3 family protein [Mucilaginibacter rubeus]SDH25566.1 Gluconate 2-dehydrogenase subunit 3 [Mucilaginibacter gossypii]